MSKQKPIILNQAELDWEGWDGPGVAAEGPLRWKILISGERGPSSSLTTGIAEMTPGALLALHHHEPEETYYVISGNGHVTIDDSAASLGLVRQSLYPLMQSTRFVVPAPRNWFSYSLSQQIGSTKLSTISMHNLQLAGSFGTPLR